TAVEAGVIADGVVSQSEAQAKAIWHLRFAVSEANRLAGPSVSHDVSVATADVPALLAALPDRIHLNFQAQTLFVGHVGDGNMHVIVLFSRDAFLTSGAYEDTAQKVNAIVYDVVTSFGGSISAEHGIG
ncbi:FAD-binding oxidoreductase, partial [Corallococcus exiguus]|uniref:FAD-binding oxidoreductase n=1 Tax=Corallococcus exiguus TaxID=83462 RepID=UPI001801A8A1